MTIAARTVNDCLHIFGNRCRRLQCFALNDGRIGKIRTEKLNDYENREQYDGDNFYCLFHFAIVYGKAETQFIIRYSL